MGWGGARPNTGPKEDADGPKTTDSPGSSTVVLAEGETTPRPLFSHLAGLLPPLALVGTYVGVVLWFDLADVYHQHYFDAGPLVAADNAMRVSFVFLLGWLVYAPGAALGELIAPDGVRAAMTPTERAIAGFGLGVGLWETAMLILGEAGLYYRPVIAGICFVVVLTSARHFGKVATAGSRVLATRIAALRRGRDASAAFCAAVIGIALAWLLLVRGLYPGGGHDYYTHYFYYYLEVLKNHNLSPNDVWYHYYYSKGYGLVFLGMLLTDPEAPALVSFVCVAVAAIAIAALIARMAPRSLWPACGALLYVLHSLVSINRMQGGDFQHDHETIAALIVLVVWGLCMARRGSARPYSFVSASSAVAASIISQSIGIILGLYFAVISLVALVRRRWDTLPRHLLIGAAIGSTVLGIFALNYVQTGLATDQPLDTMLRFADMSRLDRWGVIPQLVIIAWSRDNYEASILPSFYDLLRYFMRLDAIWPVFAAAVMAAGIAFAPRLLRRRPAVAIPAPPGDAAAAAIVDSLVCLLSLLAVLIAISIPVGRVQNGSYERFSSFFVPLLVLLGIAFCAWTLLTPLGPWRRRIISAALPSFLVVGTVLNWQQNCYAWIDRAYLVTEHALRFLDGHYSIAEAYSHQEAYLYRDVGLPFGGINPEAVAAWRHVPPGAAIWASNVYSYCMVPGCWIESVSSFKLSPRIVDILNDSPEKAKELLQEAGLNYFLLLKDRQLVDVLSYSRLFAPGIIGKYLGVAWTDGDAFLLTWKGPDTTPIDAKFLDAYNDRLNEPQFWWLRYRELIPQFAAATERLRVKPRGEPPSYPWREN